MGWGWELRREQGEGGMPSGLGSQEELGGLGKRPTRGLKPIVPNPLASRNRPLGLGK